jgi:hypothetical protein
MAYMATALLKAIETAEMDSRIEALKRLNKPTNLPDSQEALLQ